MGAKKRHNIANGIISVFVLGCGIAFCVMVSCLGKRLGIDKIRDHDIEKRHQGFDERHHEFDGRRHEFDGRRHDFDHFGHRAHHQYNMCWTMGFAFIITSIIGIISAFVKARGAYITHMVFGIITLVVKGALLVFAIYGITAVGILRGTDKSCISVGKACMCDNVRTYEYSCDNIDTMYSMMIGILVIVFVGWVLTLVTTILAGILGCRKQAKSEKNAGIPTTTTAVQFPDGLPPKAGYLPQTHDKADLVSNMEYVK